MNYSFSPELNLDNFQNGFRAIRIEMMTDC